MKLSDFVLIKTFGNGPTDWEYTAEVTVTEETGFLFWKKIYVSRRPIHRKYAGFWFFMDNGNFTPGFQAEELEQAYKAKQLMSKTEPKP